MIHLTEKVRAAVPGLNMMVNMGHGSFKSQFKKADKSGAKFAIIIGEEELDNQLYSIKALQDRSFGQKQMSFDELITFLHSVITV